MYTSIHSSFFNCWRNVISSKLISLRYALIVLAILFVTLTWKFSALITTTMIPYETILSVPGSTTTMLLGNFSVATKSIQNETDIIRKRKGIVTNLLLEFMGVGRRAVAPWIFIHGTDIVDKGVIVLFFCLFSVVLPGRGLIVLFFGIFSVAPPLWNFFCLRPLLELITQDDFCSRFF